MTERNIIVSTLNLGSVVGIVDSPRARSKALRLPAGAVDFLEWRSDSLGCDIPEARFPWIVTARHPSEGGNNSMSLTARRQALSVLLPSAAVVDVEVRSIASMGVILREASEASALVLASFHDFQKTPTLTRLRDVVRQAQDYGADAIKIAARTSSPGDVARLLELFSMARLPLSVMGMGPLGMASRVLFANCGSVLNYGWLDAPNVPGQWSAKDLRAILSQCSGQDPD